MVGFNIWRLKNGLWFLCVSVPVDVIVYGNAKLILTKSIFRSKSQMMLVLHQASNGATQFHL